MKTFSFHLERVTVEPDSIATEMSAFPSNPSGNQNDSNLPIGIPQIGRQLPYEV